VIVEGVATDAEEDLVPLAPVGGQRRVKDDGNQGPDVLDPNGLEMELGDHRIGRVGPRACHSRRAWREEEATVSVKSTIGCRSEESKR